MYRIDLVFDDDARAEAEPLLDDAEWRRMAAYQATAQRTRFAVGRAAVRRLLGEHLGVAPAAVPLVAPRHRKPHLGRLAGSTDLRFNVAHSGSMLLCALADSAEVGVDVETGRTERELAAVIATAFTPAERDEIAELQVEARHQAALRQWTRKEAVLKATGTGLRTPPAKMDVPMTPGRPAAGVILDIAGTPWRLWDLDMSHGAGAVVAEGRTDRRLVVIDR